MWLAEVARERLDEMDDPEQGIIVMNCWSGLTTKQNKELKKESLCDTMTNLESAFNTLTEATTTEISKQQRT